jgi:hypothetical protein
MSDAVPTRSQQIEKLVQHLRDKSKTNPFALIAIDAIHELRERHKDWVYEDELPENYDYDANYAKSEIRDGVRMFPRSSLAKH